MRESLFEGWKEKDALCESLEQVRNMAEGDRLAWMLGLKGGVPGSGVGIKLIKGFLVKCWDRRSNVLGLRESEARVGN